MKPIKNQLITGRRDALRLLGLGSAALFTGGLGNISTSQAKL